MSIKKIICVIFVLLFASEVTLAIEEELIKQHIQIKDGSVLSITDCVSSAFNNSPKIKRQKYVSV